MRSLVYILQSALGRRHQQPCNRLSILIGRSRERGDGRTMFARQEINARLPRAASMPHRQPSRSPKIAAYRGRSSWRARREANLASTLPRRRRAIYFRRAKLFDHLRGSRERPIKIDNRCRVLVAAAMALCKNVTTSCDGGRYRLSYS